MKLNYKASNIARAEREHKRKFFSAFEAVATEPSVDDMLFLCLAGGATEDEIDKEFAKGIQNIMLAIMEGANEAGFLGKKVPREQLRATFEKVMSDAKKQLVSQSSGETAKS